MPKMCEKCREKPACVRSGLFPNLCFACGCGPRLDAKAREYKERKKKPKTEQPPKPKPLFFK